jgi:glycerol dehydrogenase-like iron-containing ADH family enzyme
VSDDSQFTTVFGRGLIEELPKILPRPYLVVSMDDLWPRFAPAFDDGIAAVHLVSSLETETLQAAADELPASRAVVGLGGGQAIDVAKFFAWSRGLKLFQVPTAMTVNAPFGQRAGVRERGIVRYLGWAVPEAVYVDIEVIQSAPVNLNRSGIGDIVCYHTAHADWRLAHDLGREEPRWPYDEGLVDAARIRLDSVLDHLDDIREVNETGIRTLMLAHRWGGAAFHDAGWNPRHIEGVEHFFFYNLERLTGRHFIHGQPVGLGVYIGSILQDNDPDAILAAITRAGVDIRPEAMGVTWADVEEAIRTLPEFVRDAGLWFSVVDARPIPGDILERVRSGIAAAYAGQEAGP